MMLTEIMKAGCLVSGGLFSIAKASHVQEFGDAVRRSGLL